MKNINTSGTKCPKCESNAFELVIDRPSNSLFKMHYLRCSSCQTFLQALPLEETNHKIEQLQHDINKILAKMYN